jgi:hypothetical protein
MAAATSRSEAPVVMPTVRTIADLDQSSLIKVEGAGACRLGVSSRQVPAGDAVLVYCVWERVADTPLRAANFPGDLSRPVPLVGLRAGWRWAGPSLLDVDGGVLAYPAARTIAGELYVASIPVVREGLQELVVCDGGGQAIATVQVEVTPPAGPAWKACLPPRATTAGSPPNAVPYFNGAVPYRSRPALWMLPTLIPERAGLLHAQVDTRGVVLWADDEICSRTDWTLLIQFWVNGTPVVWTSSASRIESTGRCQEVESLPLNADWSRLSGTVLRRGDFVELRFLYCEGGWMYTDNGHVQHASPVCQDGFVRMLLSKLVAFEWGG